jgi:hypothetical protein
VWWYSWKLFSKVVVGKVLKAPVLLTFMFLGWLGPMNKILFSFRVCTGRDFRTRKRESWKLSSTVVVFVAAAVQSIILYLGFKSKIDELLVDGLEELVSPFPHPVVLVNMNRFRQCLAYRLVDHQCDYCYTVPD